MDIEKGIDPREQYADWKAPENLVEQQPAAEVVESKVDITPEQFQRALELMAKQERYGNQWVGHVENDMTQEGGVNIFHIPAKNEKGLASMDQFLANNGFVGSDNEHTFPRKNHYHKFLIEASDSYMYRVGAKERANKPRQGEQESQVT